MVGYKCPVCPYENTSVALVGYHAQAAHWMNPVVAGARAVAGYRQRRAGEAE